MQWIQIQFLQAYFLEVSSPGAERPLKKESDYEQAVGKYIHISLYQAVDGEKNRLRVP